jgi:hypothetical protein
MARQVPNRRQAGGSRRPQGRGAGREAPAPQGLRRALSQGGLPAALVLTLLVVVVFFALGYLVGRLFL